MSRGNKHEQTFRNPDHVANKMELVKLCENELGWAWSWDDPRPAWKVRQIEVGKLNRTIKKVEKEQRWMYGKFTVENLVLAVELLKRERKFIESPAVLPYWVERALEVSAVPDPADAPAVAQGRKTIVDRMMNLPVEADRARWFSRLSRTVGKANVEVVAEFERWEASNG